MLKILIKIIDIYIQFGQFDKHSSVLKDTEL